jgi:hypothetical protein
MKHKYSNLTLHTHFAVHLKAMICDSQPLIDFHTQEPAVIKPWLQYNLCRFGLLLFYLLLLLIIYLDVIHAFI